MANASRDISDIIAHLPGARNETSTTEDYLRTLPQGEAIRLATGTTETLVTANPAIVLALVGNTGHAGDTSLRDAASTGGGSTPVFALTVPANGEVQLSGALFANGITLQGGALGHDATLIWAPL